jgi:Na+/proline symporter
LVIFTVALISAVLSTIDSAILSPASVLSQNVFERFNHGRIPSLTLNRIAIVVVTAGSVGVAYLGESAYALLEDAYELPLVSLFVPLAFGLKSKYAGERSAITAMVVGAGLWMFHYAADWEYFLEPWTSQWQLTLPVSLTVTLISLLAYWLANSGRNHGQI